VGALTLVIEKDAHAKLTEGQRALYVEKDGKFHLDVDGVEDVSGLKSALEKERKAAKLAEQARKDLEKRFEGIDPEKVKKMIEEMGDDEEAKLMKAGKVDEVVAKRTEKLRKELEKQVADARKAAEAEAKKAQKFSQQVLDNHIRQAATKAGMHANAVDDALFRGRVMFTLNEEGEPVQVDKDGQPVFGKDGKTPFSPVEWLEGMKEQAPHWFPAGSSGGGARGGDGKNAAGKKTMKREAFERLNPMEKQNFTVKEQGVVVD
jgi:hypothetical protein